MKTFIILMLSVVNLSCKTMPKTSTTTLPIGTLKAYLTQLNLTQFVNKPIDSFLVKIPQNYTSLKVSGGSRTDIASLLIVEYATGINISIRVTNFSHLNRYNPNKLPPEQAWPLAQMRKENIYSIRIYDGYDLIKSFNE